MLKKFSLKLLFLLLIRFAATAQVPENALLFNVDDAPVTAGEFRYAYTKNAAYDSAAFTEESIREYLQLYINFKLKVAAAQQAGYSDTKAFESELNSYQRQLAQPYLTDRQLTDQLLQEAYQRQAEAVNASHILFKVEQGASPADTLLALKKAQNLYEQLQQYAPASPELDSAFAAMAAFYSADPGSGKQGGALGWFTGFQMVYPFESAAYTTPVGQVSEPVRSQFGYHLVKVNGRTKAPGEVTVAHLMVRVPQGAAPADSVAAAEKIAALYTQLQNGAAWNELVQNFSEDVNSRSKQGHLPPFTIGQMPEPFAEAAFALKEAGEFSNPVRTPYGWHILKLLKREPVGSFVQMQQQLSQKLSRTERAALPRQQYINRLKSEYISNNNTRATQKAKKAIVEGSAISPEEVLFQLAGVPVKSADFAAFAQQPNWAQVQKRTDTGDYLFERFTEKLLLEHEESLLPQKYPEYRYLLQEYQEGTLLFSIMQDSIWSRAATDSAGLAQFFAQNSERYQWPERAEATVFSMATPALQQQAAAALTAGYLTTDTFSYTTSNMSAASAQELFSVWLAEVTAAETPRYAEQLNVVFTYHKKADEQLLQALQQQLTDSLKKLPVSITTNMVRKYRKKQLEVQLFTRQLSPANIAAWYNRSQPLSATAATEIFTAETLPQGVQWQKGVQQAQQNGRYVAVRINELLAAGPQQLTEVRGLVTSQYQQHLEQQWLQQLNKRFKVVIDEPVFAELLAELTR